MIIAVDTETTGLNPHLGDYAFMATWAHEDCSSNAVFLRHDDLTPFSALVLNPEVEVVGHNLGFDVAFLEHYGLRPCGTWHDTMIAAHVFNSSEPSKGLKALAKKYLKRENTEEQRLEEWFMKNGMVSRDNRKYIEVPAEIIVPYAKADVEMTMQLFQFYKRQGVIDDPIYKMEMQVLPVVVNIVRSGMRVDKQYAKEKAMWATARVQELLSRAKSDFNIENLGSNQELGRLLFDKAKLECKIYTPKGTPCLDEVALQEYDHPIVPLVTEYRDMVKTCSTYLTPMLERTDAEGRLHSSLNQVGARTGRMTSSNPNLQNITRSGGEIDIRRCFIPADGFKLFFIDLSQIELRVLAHYCKDEVMLTALQPRSGDLHTATAQMLFNKTEKKYRTIAKTINFATIYGAGIARLTESLNKALPEMQLTDSQVRQFKAQYYAGYPGLQNFIWRVEDLIRKRGYVKDVFGRKYPCEADVAYRAVNYVIQGCSAGIFKTALIKLDEYLRQNNLKTRLINLIHDEFIFELHESEMEIMPRLQEIVEDFHQFRVPIYANAALSQHSWADKEELQLLK